METSRGHYKIFLGMAAGVGKTYRMLQEARAEAEAGRDVVIGYLEPHGRVETEALAEGLEMLPRRQVSYRGATTQEMDLPAVLARSASSTSSRIPTRPGSSTRSATRTSTTCSMRASTSSPR
jgi:K+-sensing histidine kinase KdpD